MIALTTLQHCSEVAGHPDKNFSMSTNRRRVIDDDLDIGHHSGLEHAAQQFASHFALALEHQFARSRHRSVHNGQPGACIARSRASTVSHHARRQFLPNVPYCFYSSRPLLVCLVFTYDVIVSVTKRRPFLIRSVYSHLKLPISPTLFAPGKSLLAVLQGAN